MNEELFQRAAKDFVGRISLQLIKEKEKYEKILRDTALLKETSQMLDDLGIEKPEGPDIKDFIHDARKIQLFQYALAKICLTGNKEFWGYTLHKDQRSAARLGDKLYLKLLETKLSPLHFGVSRTSYARPEMQNETESVVVIGFLSPHAKRKRLFQEIVRRESGEPQYKAWLKLG